MVSYYSERGKTIEGGRGRYGFSDTLLSGETSRRWDEQKALGELLDYFSNPYDREKIISASKITKNRLEQRWTLGFEGVIQYPDSQKGEVNYFVLSSSQLSENNRYRHSVEAAKIALLIADSVRREDGQKAFSEQDKLVLAFGILYHDLGQKAFSHFSDNLLRRSIDSFKGEEREEFKRELEKRSLLGDHEERILGELYTGSSDAAILAEEVFGNTSELSKVLREEGALGKIASLADTAAYLRIDSEFFGMESPDYESLLKENLYINKNEELSIRSKTVISLMLARREYLFRRQYHSAQTLILEEMQRKSFEGLVNKTGKGDPALTAAQMDRFLSLNDSKLLMLLRRNALISQNPYDLGFFGIIPPNIRIDLKADRNSLEVKNGFRPKSIKLFSKEDDGEVEISSAAQGDKVLERENEVRDNFFVSFGGDFKSGLMPLLKKVYPVGEDGNLIDLYERDISFSYKLPNSILPLAR